MKFTSQIRFYFASLFMAALVLLCSSQGAYAANADTECSMDATYAINYTQPGQGPLSGLISQVQGKTKTATQTIFKTFSTDATIVKSIAAAAIIYVMIYGFYIGIGAMSLNLADIVVRIGKLAAVALLCTPQSWGFFSNNVVAFFNGGTDYIIGEINKISVNMIVQLGLQAGGGNPYGMNGLLANAPFAPLDDAFSVVFSARTIVTIMGYAFAGPYGMFYAALMVLSAYNIMKMVLNGLWIYLMAMIIRVILLGMAPIFIVCILFQRMRFLFDGWLNQVLNTCLQPIFVFIFIGLYTKMVEFGAWKMIDHNVCWTRLKPVEGDPVAQHYWRPLDVNGNLSAEPLTWNGGGAGSLFPVTMLDMLIFLFMTLLALRFFTVVVGLAKELAGASTSLISFAGMPSFMQPIVSAVATPIMAAVGFGVAGLAAKKMGEREAKWNPDATIANWAARPFMNFFDRNKKYDWQRPGKRE